MTIKLVVSLIWQESRDAQKSERTGLVKKVNLCVNSGAKGRNESDNHADTACSGRNWRPLSFTGKVCEVMPFSKGLGTMKGVEACTACALCAEERTGRNIIIVANEGLWMGDVMANALTNPNQC